MKYLCFHYHRLRVCVYVFPAYWNHLHYYKNVKLFFIATVVKKYIVQKHRGSSSFAETIFHSDCWIHHTFYFGGSSRRQAVKYSWLCCVLKIRLISTPSLFSSSAFLLSLPKEQHKHVIHLSHNLCAQSGLEYYTEPCLYFEVRPALILLEFNSCSSTHKSIDWIILSVVKHAAAVITELIS